MNNKTAIIIAAAAFFLFQQQQQAKLRQQQLAQQYIAQNPPPPMSSANFGAWANSITQVVGSVSALFQQGGPFSRWSKEEKDFFESQVIANCTLGNGGFGIPGVC